MILFRDGLEVEAEMLQKQWHLPLRKLVLAMPITAAVVAVGTHLLTNLNWTESFLLGALLSPTDPVLSSSVVTNSRVPRLIRHSLNLESGLNDGLALPAVLALATALGAGASHFVWWRFVLQNVLVGFATGIVLGLVASWVMPRDERLEGGIPGYQKSLYALGAAFATYGVTELPPHGNGLIAVYVAAIVLGTRRPDIRSYFEHYAADLVEIVKVAVFVVFGSLLTLNGCRRRLGRRRDSGRGAARRPARGRVHRADRDGDRLRDAGIHVVVRAQGGLDDDVLAARPDLTNHGGGPDLQPRRADGPVLGARARADRHPGRELDRASLGAPPRESPRRAGRARRGAEPASDPGRPGGGSPRSTRSGS